MIPREIWLRYVRRQTALERTAKAKMEAHIDAAGLGDPDNLIGYAYGVATTYGEASAALAATMYDEMAELAGVALPAAELADTATFAEVAVAINGVLRKSQNTEILSSSVSRLVKQAGADTTLKNAIRDGAEFAWVPHGDTCAFCVMLASNGWKRASKKALKNGHAEHIHSNCDCEYAVRFDSSTTVAGYDPDKYLQMYEDAEGAKWQDKVNSMRREFYAENSEEINAQKRSAYAKRRELESSRAEEIDVGGGT